MKTMKVMAVNGRGSGVVLQEKPVPDPDRGEVRIQVHACGICFSDHLVTDGLWPGLQFPRVPGHEIAGVIDAIGEGVSQLKVGDRVGVGWHGGHDGTCDACLSGDFIGCQQARITGISSDGGYEEYMVAPATAVARVPDGMPLTHAAPLLCAGLTTYNALRNSDARAGDLVGIQGLGGLGHLGVQFARAMGFEVVAISRGSDKEAFARKLGAHHYIDAQNENLAQRMQALGGARVILATAPSSHAIGGLVSGLGRSGCLTIVAAPFEPIQVSAVALISGKKRIQGWASGTAIDSTETMKFAQQTGIVPMIETFPLDDAAKALEHTMNGTVRFRSVLQVV